MAMFLALVPLIAGFAAWSIGRHTEGVLYGVVAVLATMTAGPIVSLTAQALVVPGGIDAVRMGSAMAWFFPFGLVVGAEGLRKGRKARREALTA
ncbi:MAG TPA: hypothetical protein VJ890_10340 [Vineibacter sp.]|nr:hypothetical protein [Vineibacter sp.]